MKINQLILLTAYFFCSTVQETLRAQSAISLDGNSYSILLSRPKGINTTGWKADTFVFESGEMYSDCLRKQEGFKSALYNPKKSESDQGMMIKFLYEATNRYGSTLKIEGTVIGNKIEGTATWINDRGAFEYLFVGSLLEDRDD